MTYPEDLLGQEFGGYILEEVLGSGGMGFVYRAKKQGTGNLQYTAIKLLKKALVEKDRIYAERFNQEIRNIKNLRNSPNIVRVQDDGEKDGWHYLVMDYYEGETLKERIEREAIPLKAAIGIFRDIARAIDAAHEGQVIHRDIKPSNILFDEKGQPVLADFGISKNLNHDASLTVGFIGTPAYSAPELFGENPVEANIKTDLYSFGVLVYDVLTRGHFPAKDTSSISKIERWHKSLNKTLLTNVPRGVAAAVRKMMDVNPKKRFNSATEFVLAMELALNEGKRDPEKTIILFRMRLKSLMWRVKHRTRLIFTTYLVQYRIHLAFALVSLLLIISIISMASRGEDDPAVTEAGLVADTETVEVVDTTPENSSVMPSTFTVTVQPTRTFTHLPTATAVTTSAPSHTTMPTFTPSRTATLTKIPTMTASSTATARPSDTPTSTATFTDLPPATPTLIVALAFVPSGSMQISGLITNQQYEDCENAGSCIYPSSAIDRFRSPLYDNEPVVGITWFNAQQFCRAMGGRLPLAGEWETIEANLKSDAYREWLAQDVNNVQATIEAIPDSTMMSVVGTGREAIQYPADFHWIDIGFRCVLNG